jgi:glyoxylase-like metal-dependent hydrolase (beta-lactamase superfamily II)
MALFPASVTDYAHGISAIDSGYVRPTFDAIHLIVQEGRAALVDTGTSRSLPRVLEALQGKGLSPAQVDWIILTHIHLDHAGGAGAMMRAFPGARLAVHPRGARHMADPSHLVAGATAVYGEATMKRLYGEIPPIDKARIVEMAHGATIKLGSRELLFLDTPGHARHHVCVVDSVSGHVFCGDTFGLSYRELDIGERQFTFPTCAPVQFDPEAFHRSLDLVAGYKPEAVYVTHYSQVRDIPRLMGDMHRLIDCFAKIGLRHAEPAPGRQKALQDGFEKLLLEESRRQGWQLDDAQLLKIFDPDLELNAMGLESWLDSRQAKR